jgi:tRNA (guanine26-N2/guanine27-N2)-dimethyltransferase
MLGPVVGPETRQWHRQPRHCQTFCSPHSAVWAAEADTALNTSDRHYREGAATLRLGTGFFRQESRPARDVSVLLARHQRDRVDGRLHWLDLMAGCGIRGLRWGLEAAACHPDPVELWVNDADPNRLPLIKNNLQAVPIPVQIGCEPAEVLLGRCALERKRFDLIDLDAFGAPSALIQPVLKALKAEGLLLLASTDGRSPTGHDRPGAIRSLGAAARAHPASWEMALRQQIGLVARQAWMLGFGVKPLVSFSEGRTFKSGRWSVNGPLWIGCLQDSDILDALLADPLHQKPGAIAAQSQRLLRNLREDPGLPVTVWPTDELARRLNSPGPPSLDQLVHALRRAGHRANRSGVMPGQVRTDADFPELLRICSNLRADGI